MRTRISLLSTFFLIAACGSQTLPGTPEDTSFEAGSAEEQAVLSVVNDPAVTFEILDVDAALDRRAAENIIAHRDGADELAATADDDLFDSIAELDDIPWVGPAALANLLDYAIANGYYDDADGWARERAILAVVNTADFETLDDDARLDRRAAENIVARRNGPDGVSGTPDDRDIMSLAELDAISYVGNSAIAGLYDYALNNGFVSDTPVLDADVIFSPQAYWESHTARVVEVIDSAQYSLDIAMYSFSDQGVYDALERAVNRGVKVRFVFHTASEDRKLEGSALESSRSTRLEKMGINVRWVNKIMHHKFVIVDGPRDDLARAETARIATGSGNWSYGAATIYDENTLFLSEVPELTLRLQREFNLMWNHSRDFVWDATLPYELSTLEITDEMIPDDPNTDGVFTSGNFKVVGDDTFYIVTGRDTVSDRLVEAIQNATDSIDIASGHLRSRPISEALMAKAASDPDVDIRIYLDGQEYISEWYHGEQVDDLEDCLANADTPAQVRHCEDSGFYFGYEVGELNGIPLRYKYYSYRWHYKSAKQMHHKLMIIDGDELWTGSYNLSNNAEHNTFENMLQIRGWEMAPIIRAYQQNFSTLWKTHVGDHVYEKLMDDVSTADDIPLIFEPMALDWNQIDQLKDAIEENCPVLFTDPYRNEPWKYATCPRNP